MSFEYDDSDNGYSTSPPPSRKRRRRGARQFLFLVPIEEGYDDCVRADFLEMFSGFDIEMYCISLEPRYCGHQGICRTFLHAYLEFVEEWYPQDLQVYIENNLPEEPRANMDLQVVQNKKEALTKVSQVDQTPFFNCSEHDLSFAYRAYRWALQTTRFVYHDPFVTQNRRLRNFLRLYHADVRSKLPDTFSLRPYEFTYLCQWTIECALWFNSRLTPDNRFKRKPQLYLYGPTGVGKTSFIQLLIGLRNWSRVYLPGPGRRGFSDLNPMYHKVVLFEEVDACKLHVEDLKRLVDGRPFPVPVRGNVPKQITFKGHVILVSIDFNLTDPGLLSRLKIVEARARYWTYPHGPLPKEQPDDEDVKEDIIVISADDDDDDKSIDLAIPGPSSRPP